ncbi:MAG: NAD-glutamate dehydrogenase [Deferrisomatales bacterium]
MSPSTAPQTMDQTTREAAASVGRSAPGHGWHRRALAALGERDRRAREHLDWLAEHMNPYFFVTMGEEMGVLARLALELADLPRQRRAVLWDAPDRLVLARAGAPGSVYQTLRDLPEREISYAELIRSRAPLPGSDRKLEVYRFEFRRKAHAQVAATDPGAVPRTIRRSVQRSLASLYPEADRKELLAALALLWANHPEYVRLSPPERVARALWLYRQGHTHGGMFLGVENSPELAAHGESRLLFAVGNPPAEGFLLQVMEIFHRLDVGIARTYCLNLSTGVHPYFLGTFYGASRSGELVGKDTALFRALQGELYNTQILSTATRTYTGFVRERMLAGQDASLVDAFIAFCHTALAHTRPDAFGLEDVRRAFHSHPELAVALVELFRLRFDPDRPDRQDAYRQALADVTRTVEEYNTGRRFLDEFRRTIFRVCLSFIRHTLKTNFFVPEKHALAFRLDPAYLEDLPAEFLDDLPPARPFRVTFFFGRHAVGYHIGFSDIARGGWRTVLTRGRDDYVTNANPLFRETYVLAHTQHLKNKDIYEGGSKLVAVVDADGLDADGTTERLHQVQYGFLNAFLDLFVTRDGRAAHPRVVDYYGQDEPIELGPDENMHDSMVELIAHQAAQRGYLLGSGIISSKRAGINHKRYGVTSLGVLTFARVTLEQLGLDMGRDPFTVKFTGGPNGDVAGNAMRLLLERCPGGKIVLIVDGTGACYDPEGIDREELGRLVLRADLDAFDPRRLHPGGFLLYRTRKRREGRRELYRKAVRTPEGVEDRWVSSDEFHREYTGRIFTTPADLFLPAGGRPETVDGDNWRRLFQEDGTPTCRAVVEGANSFFSPEAREALQRRGVIVIRDASANKCGVIASSYEILGNLLLSEREFLAHREAYVADVLAILERRAEDEARLIFRRWKEEGGRRLWTEISDALSAEINGHYDRFFAFFQGRPGLCGQKVFREALLSHLPPFVRKRPRLRARVQTLPPKVRSAVLASEIASSIVYRGGWTEDLEPSLRAYLERTRTQSTEKSA